MDRMEKEPSICRWLPDQGLVNDFVEELLEGGK